MDRVPDFESVGCGFDPRRGHYIWGFLGDLPPHLGVFSQHREVSVQVGATQPTQDEHEAHVLDALHVHPFCYALSGTTLSKISIAFSNPPGITCAYI